MHLLKLAAIVTMVLVTGCAVGPDYKRPPTVADLPQEFREFADNPAVAIDSSMAPWWQRIEDPEFTADVQTLLADNLSLRAATERVLQAEARLTIQQGGQRPNISVGGSGGRTFNPNPIGNTPERIYADTFAADLNVGWTVDLFGRVSNSIVAGRATFAASLADREALQHALIAELLTRRVSVATNHALVALAEQNVRNRELLFTLVKQRYEMGARGAQLADVYLAEDSVSSVRAEAAEFARILADETYRLDVLLGRQPGATTAAAPKSFPLLAPPPPAPIAFPAELLDRRPDLRASDLRAQAANANLGVAIADLYPQFQITGRLGGSSETIDNLFSYEQMAGSLLAGINQQLFAGGALRANIDLQEAAAREAATNYAAQILEALREVESALQADRRIAKQLSQQTLSLEALRNAERLNRARYRDGLIPLQTYLEIETRRYRTEQSWVRLQQLRWNTRVSLYLALGGDWETNPSTDN
ncbi:MAG: efflux transporter outer membrane subunit [Synoicihabitans sp.]